MNENRILTYLRLIIALTAMAYLIYLGVVVEEFNPLILAAVIICIIPDITRLTKMIIKSRQT